MNHVVTVVRLSEVDNQNISKIQRTAGSSHENHLFSQMKTFLCQTFNEFGHCLETIFDDVQCPPRLL